jgi:multiple sugar transport system ATP-binding protein
VAQVIFENVYKSFPTSKIEQSLTLDGDNKSKEQSHLTSVNVLRNINLTVQDGEFMVLVGQSGCGKSTLLRLLAGLETLTGGNIYIGDRSVSSLSHQKLETLPWYFKIMLFIPI